MEIGKGLIRKISSISGRASHSYSFETHDFNKSSLRKLKIEIKQLNIFLWRMETRKHETQIRYQEIPEISHADFLMYGKTESL